MDKKYYRVKKLDQVMKNGWKIPKNLGLIEISLLDENINEISEPTFVQVNDIVFSH